MNYEFVIKWGQLTGSNSYYIDQQVKRAKQDKAPENATYYSTIHNRWMTTDDIKGDSIKKQLGLLPVTKKTNNNG